jgi:hypothetical protein
VHAIVPGEGPDAVSSSKGPGVEEILAKMEKMEKRMLALEGEVAGERQMKEDSEAKLRRYTVDHGIASSTR